MSHFTGAGALGGLLDDFQQAVAIVQQTAGNGSIGPWLSERLARLNRLPGDVARVRAQVIGLQSYFSQHGNPVAPMTDLAHAESLLDEIDANAPEIQQRVGQLTVTLLPVLPKLQAGTMDDQVLSALGTSGFDLAGTFHDVNGILANYDQACQLVTKASTEPTLSPQDRIGARQAMTAGATSDLVKYAVLGGIAFLVIRSVR